MCPGARELGNDVGDGIADAGDCHRLPPSVPGPIRVRGGSPDFIDPRPSALSSASCKCSPFQFHGFEGKRRVVSFDWRYDFNGGSLKRTDDFPPFVVPIRDAAAAAFGGYARPPHRIKHGGAAGWFMEGGVDRRKLIGAAS
jgi:hypothetical protein